MRQRTRGRVVLACAAFWLGMLPIAGAVLTSADLEFLSRAKAVSEAEARIASFAARNAAREETQALAQRIIAYHARLAAALGEYQRLRKARVRSRPFPQLDELARSFAEKTGKEFDKAFREFLRTDPAGLIPLYHRGAAAARDRVLRRLAERTYGELKLQRPLAAQHFLKSRRAAAQKERKADPLGITPKRAKKRGAAMEITSEAAKRRSAETSRSAKSQTQQKRGTSTPMR